MKKRIIGYLVLIFSIWSCIYHQALAYDYTGAQINSKFKTLQSMVIFYEYEDEDGRPGGYVSAKVYQIKKDLCAIVTILNTDMGFIGYESVIYFSNRKMIDGYIRSVFYKLSDDELTRATTAKAYGEMEEKSVYDRVLTKDFHRYYLKKMKKSTLDKCR